MPKMANSFRAKGELDMDNVVVYEVVNKGKKDEYIEAVNLLGFLKAFHGKEISISITADEEVFDIVKDVEEDDEE